MENFTNQYDAPQEDTPIHENGSTYVPPYESEPYRYTYVTPNPSPQARYEPAPKQQKKKRRYAWVIVLALCFSIFGSALGAGGVLFAQHYMAQEEEPVTQEETFCGLESLKTEIGTGSVICMANDLLPIDEKNWYVPVWLI